MGCISSVFSKFACMPSNLIYNDVQVARRSYLRQQLIHYEWHSGTARLQTGTNKSTWCCVMRHVAARKRPWLSYLYCTWMFVTGDLWESGAIRCCHITGIVPVWQELTTTNYERDLYRAQFVFLEIPPFFSFYHWQSSRSNLSSKKIITMKLSISPWQDWDHKKKKTTTTHRTHYLHPLVCHCTLSQ